MFDEILKYFADSENGRFTGFCVLRKGAISTTSNQKTYANLTLFDGKEEIAGKIWDFEGSLPDNNSVVKVQGTLGEYQGKTQIVIRQWRIATEDEYQPDQFIPVYPGDRDLLLENIKDYFSLIQDPGIKSVISSVWNKYRVEWYDAPAAKKYHHAYLGGFWSILAR